MSYLFKMWASNKIEGAEATANQDDPSSDWAKKILIKSENLNHGEAIGVVMTLIITCTLVFLAIICYTLLYMEDKITTARQKYVDRLLVPENSLEDCITEDSVHFADGRFKSEDSARAQNGDGATNKKELIRIAINESDIMRSVDV